jgi:AbrB family looped-hinge helix DNA binding protein
MNLARVSNNGQITVPVEIRRALKVKAGDKILFFRKDNGEIIVQNPNISAIEEAQTAVVGCNYSEDEILADVMNLRYEETRT